MRKELKSKEKFTEYYIKNFSTWVFKKQLFFYSSKLDKLKTKKWKDDYIYLLYSSYMQLIENFLIFFLVLFQEKWVENIFSFDSNNNIKNLFWIIDNNWKIEYSTKFDLFLRDKIWTYIWTNENEYLKYIKESIKDYYTHKDLLNSYKHWFRLNSNWAWKTFIWMNDKNFLVWDYDSSILYYTKKRTTIFENIYYFNYEYIILKAQFIINLIDNLKLNYLNVWKEINFETIYVNDDIIKSKFPTSLTRMEIFEIKNN